MTNAESFSSTVADKNSHCFIDFEQSVFQYFQDLTSFLHILNQHKQELEKFTSIDFNVFTYIPINEDYFSNIIVDILNPEGVHGQGLKFLRAFMELLKNENVLTMLSQPSVSREVHTKQFRRPLRRMDILIDWSDFGIMIENKPKTVDQEAQLEDYSTDLTNKYGEGKYIIVYLTNEGRTLNPDSLSDKTKEKLEKSNQFFHFTYQLEFEQWIQSCIAVCQSDKYRWFLRDFQSYILNNYLKS